MKGFRRFEVVSAAAFAGTLALANVASAASPVATCSSNTLGNACTTSGGDAGICESVTCTDNTPDSGLDGGAEDAGGPCYGCVSEPHVALCGAGDEARVGSSSTSSFAPIVSGCCSVSGAVTVESGFGMLSGLGFLGLAFAARRRRRVR